MKSVKEKVDSSYLSLKEELNIKNRMASPKLVRVVVNAGTGSISDKKKKELVLDRITKLTGQKAVTRGAKKSIAGFKIRQGDAVGVVVTLRGERMHSFLDRLINIAIPRMRDFKGIDPKSVDNMGNLTIGVREHTIFPETGDEDLKDVFSLSIAIVSNARDRAEAIRFFREVGLPIRK